MPKKGFVSEKYKLAVGQKFGKLTVESVESVPGGFALFTVLCECGTRKKIRACNVINENSESCGCAAGPPRLPFGEASLRKLFRRYTNNAKHTNRSFSLNRDEFRALTSSPCHYCGAAPAQVVYGHHTNGPYVYNGLDRVDNSKGYLRDNVVPACPQCQFAKRDQPLRYFLDWAKRLAQFQGFTTS